MDEEMTAIERTVSHAQFPREGDASCCGGHTGERRGGSGGGGDSMATRLYVVSMERAGQDRKQAEEWLV